MTCPALSSPTRDRVMIGHLPITDGLLTRRLGSAGRSGRHLGGTPCGLADGMGKHKADNQ
jgi:hypothetical protein